MVWVTFVWRGGGCRKFRVWQFRIRELGLWVPSLRVEALSLGVSGSGLRVSGFGLREQGSNEHYY